MTMSRAEPVFAVPPDPGRAGSLDELIDGLRLLKVWAGDPSYDTIKDRVNAAWQAAGRPGTELTGRTTVADCFRPGRRRLNTDLVIAVVTALYPDVGYVTQWRQALQVVGGERRAAAQVRVEDRLPQDLPGFTGRGAELQLLRTAPGHGAAVVVGMAGVGKTRLVVHAGYLLHLDRPYDRTLFVNLRGFHPDPAQPPADPGAVLDGFLRLLGMPGPKIPHALAARSAAYRDRLAGTRTLVVLDDAAGAWQVEPLLPGTPGCLVLVTSRCSLDLRTTGQVEITLDVFTPGEAAGFLTRAAHRTPVGRDPRAPARIARRCGHLPLALGLVAAHISGTPGWTLTDHADRLDELHAGRHLDSGVELALDLSYRNLPADRRRLLRMAALHPGQDLDAHAAAALAGTGLPAARAHLRHLHGDHLLQQRGPGRYTFHDLVRSYASGRAVDEDSPPDRRAALTRLFDYYLATTAAAAAALHPAGTGRAPEDPAPLCSAAPVPVLTDPGTALAWLDAERHSLLAVAAHAATNGWPAHTTRLSSVLFRYLNGGYFTDALAIHGHARRAAHHLGDRTGKAHSLTNLGVVHLWLGRRGPAARYLRQALHLFQRAGDAAGQARALNNLGNVEQRLGRYQPATGHFRAALALYRRAGDRTGQARTLGNLGTVQERLGRYEPAIEHYEQALALFRGIGDRTGEAWTLNNLGGTEWRLGRHRSAGAHLAAALALFRQVGSRAGEAWTLDNLGTLDTRLGRPAEAVRHHRRALAVHRETGDRDGEAWALNGLGEAALAAGRPADAAAHHAAALAVAAEIGDRHQQSRARTGLARGQ